MLDILQPLPIEKWTLLRDSLKRDWPTYAYYHSLIENAIKWKRNNPLVELELYCPNGKHDSGIFIYVYSINLYIVYIFTFEESKNFLKEILEKTKIINWRKKICFVAIHQSFIDILLDTIDKINCKEKEVKAINYYFKPKEECTELLLEIPEECQLRHLNASHAPLVHSLWPYYDSANPHLSMKYVQSLITLNRGVGLFLKKDNSLVSWILHTESGSLGMLQTIDEHQCKGYGKIVAKAIAKELAEEENLDSTVFIYGRNVVSEKLFKSLNYKVILSATWVIFHPTEDENSASK